SGTVAGIIYLIGRAFVVWYTNGSMIGLYLAFATMFVLVGSISILRKRMDNTRPTLLIFTTISIAIFGAAIYAALPLNLFYPVLIVYTLMSYGGACAAYRLLLELRRHFENV
ncbi:MAG: GGDEF domain-containing protein, partial [Exiguobacterium sp.]